MDFVIWGTDFRHKKGEFCQRLTSELYFISCFRTDYLTEYGGELVKGRAGDILISHPGDTLYHGPTPEMSSGFSNDWIKLSGDDVGELLMRYPLPRNLPFRTSDPAVVSRCIGSIGDELAQMRAGYLDKCRMLIESMLIDLYRDYTSGDRPTTEQRLDALRGRLISDCERHWTLADIAAIAGYSPSRLSCLYKKRFGVSPIDDIIDRRIERARLLLLHGAMTVEEVSERTGFTSIYYFSRTFKSRTGISPTAFIKENQKDNTRNEHF